MTLLIAFLCFMLGSTVASFCQLFASRFPKKETIQGRSHCPSCLHALRLIDVFPLVGFLINRGKCHFCGHPIPWHHLVVELLGGLFFTLAYLQLRLTIELAAAFLLITVLFLESLSDIEFQLVIDRVWIIGLIPIVILRIAQGAFLTHLLASIVMFSLLYGLALLGKLAFRKEALGGGDIKLYLFAGFFLTWQTGLLSLFLASLLGFLFGLIGKRKGKEHIPLVPFLFFGILISYLFGAAILEWYLHLLGV